MPPSSVYKFQNLPCWKDFRKPTRLEEVKLAYNAGDYTTALDLLTSLLNNTANTGEGHSREHLLLARAMCFQQLREFEYVLSDTTEVLRYILQNSAPTSLEVQGNHRHLVSHHLALWLRSLAYESLDKWEKAKKDLEELKLLIFGSGNNTVYISGEIIFSLLPYTTPLFIRSANNAVTVNLNCVLDRLRRVVELVNKEIARRSNVSQAFHLIDNDASAFGELAKKFHYRLLLRRPLHPDVHINMWYTMDLMFVSEMGLFKREDMQGIEGYSLGVKLLEIDDHDQKVKFKAEVRSMSVESCEWSGLISTDWAGVQSGGKGGLEFRVVHADGDAPSDSRSQKRFLYVYPIMKIVKGCNDRKITRDGFDEDDDGGKEHELRLVPLVVGPIHIKNCHSHHVSCNNHQSASGSNYLSTPEPLSSVGDSESFPASKKKCSWSIDNYLVHSHRAFALPNGKHLLIKELWDVGIPGKVWDSAFVMVQMFKDRILRDRESFFGKRILDLSTGTGFAGLYLAALLANGPKSGNGEKQRERKTNIILTDLPHALRLIRANDTLNKNLFESTNEVFTSIESLRWGDKSGANKLGVIDYVIASDVVYEPDLFDSLIQTFVTICRPKHTKIYLGYKRRGLTVEDENRFFVKLGRKFHMTSLQGLPNIKDESQVYIYELSR